MHSRPYGHRNARRKARQGSAEIHAPPLKATRSKPPWDDLHLAYFSGYAMWNYLNTPFIFALPGFQTEEIEPWDENRRKAPSAQGHVSGSHRDALRRTGFPCRWRRPDLPRRLRRACRRRYTDGALLVRLSGFRRHQGRDEAAGAIAGRPTAPRSPMPVFVAIDIADISLLVRCTAARARSEQSMTDADEKRHVVTIEINGVRKTARGGSAQACWFICSATILASPERMSAAILRNAAPAPSISTDRQSNPARFWP